MGDTSFARGPKGFPKTSWGFISNLRSVDAGKRREGMETLCQRYWRPIYIYIRIAWGKSNEDAKEMTQTFLGLVMEKETLQKYEADLGSFRGYLKVILKRFLRDQALAKRALKRGGTSRIVSLDEIDTTLVAPIDPEAEDPEREFDKAWAVSVVSQAVRHVREQYESTGRLAQFQVYEKYEQAPEGNRPTYARIAESLGMSMADVRNHLHAVRKAVLAEIRAELERTVADPKRIEEEWRLLFGS